MIQSISPDTSLPWHTVPGMLADNFRRFAHKEALIDGDTRLTYADLERLTERAAASLLEMGMKSGDIVVIWAPNSWQWAVSALAVWWLGGIVAPLSARMKGLDAVPLLQLTQARILFCSSRQHGANLPELLQQYLIDSHQSAAAALPELQWIIDFDAPKATPLKATAQQLDWPGFLRLGQDRGSINAAEVAPHSTLQILFTSGSTGTPKGVMRSHYQVLRSRWDSSLNRGLSDRDSMLGINAFSHTMGLNNCLIRCLAMGMRLVLQGTFHPPEILATIARESISIMSGPPSLFSQLLIEDRGEQPALNQLRLVTIGSAFIPPSLIYSLLAKGIKTVISTYGMTECESISDTRMDGTPDIIAATVGRSSAGVSIKLVDDQDMDVPTGEVGEVWISGYGVMPGYYKNEQLTRATITADGWLRSGDMGRLTPEGNLQIVGRKKEMFIVHGFNIYPAEVESQLMLSGLLHSVAVLGQASKFSGEQCIAFVVPKIAAGFTPGTILKWAKKNMTDYKVPSKFIICDTLPLNVNNKIDKIALRKQLP